MNPNDRQMIAVALFCAIVILLLSIATRGAASEPASRAPRRLTRAEAIRHLVAPRVKYRYRLPYYSKRIKAYRDELYRRELVEAFEVASSRFDVPANLLMALAYRESVFRPDGVGPRGELGVMQVMPFVTKRRKGREYCEDVSTPEGGIMCGSWWFARGARRCDTLKGAIGAYVSGRCNPTHPRAREAVANRLWLWRYLNELTGAK